MSSEASPASDKSARPELRFDAFISYSRDDIDFAQELERVLERYRAPAGLGLESRRLRIFRDERDLTGTAYDEAIDKHLASARKLVVLCSPSARSSSFVDDEIRRFVGFRGSGGLVPVLLRGRPNHEVTSVDAADEAFPEALRDALGIPLGPDYRDFDPERHRLHRGRFVNSWYQLLANLYDRSREEVEQRDQRRRRRQRVVATSLVALIVLVLSTLAIYALRQRDIAVAHLVASQAEVAWRSEARHLERSVLLGLDSLRRSASLGIRAPAAERIVRLGQSLLPRTVFRLGIATDVQAVAFAPDGRTLATARGRVVDIRSAIDGEVIDRLESEGSVVTLEFGPQGTWLATGTQEGNATVWNLDDKTVVYRSEFRLGVDCMASSPDGRWLALAAAEDAVLLETGTWREVATIYSGGNFYSGGNVTALAFSHDGRMLALGSGGRSSDYEPTGVARILEVPDGRIVHELPHEYYVEALEFSPSGDRLASGSAAAMARVWDVSTGHEIRHVEHENWVTEITFSPSGRLVASGGADGTARVWEATSGGEQVSRMFHEAAVTAISFGAADWMLATASEDSTARIWDVRNGEEIQRLVNAGPVMAAGLSRDGRLMATVSSDGMAGTITVVETGGGAEMRVPAAGPALLSPQGGQLGVVSDDESVLVLDLPTGREALRIKPEDAVQDSPYGTDETRIAFSADETRIAVARGNTALVYEAGTGQEMHRVEFPHGEGFVPGKRSPENDLAPSVVKWIAFSPDGKWFAVSGQLGMDTELPKDRPIRRQTGEARLLNLSTDRELSLPGHDYEVAEVAFSPDSRWLATRSERGRAILLFDLTTGQEHARLDHEATGIAFGPDGELLAAAGTALTAWDVSSGTESYRAEHRGDGELSPDGRWLATAEYDEARISDPGTGEVVSVLPHESGVHTSSFGPTSDFLVTADARTARVWSVPAGTELSRLESSESIRSLSIGPEGRWLVTSHSEDQSSRWTIRARLWRLEDVIAGVCERLSRKGLTAAEWSDSVGDGSPVSACPSEAMASQEPE